MPKFETLFSKYDRLVLFDTETTGLLFSRDEIIEFAAAVLEKVDGTPKVVQEYDQLVALSPGGFVPPKIQELTGISTQDLRERLRKKRPLFLLLPQRLFLRMKWPMAKIAILKFTLTAQARQRLLARIPVQNAGRMM